MDWKDFIYSCQWDVCGKWVLSKSRDASSSHVVSKLLKPFYPSMFWIYHCSKEHVSNLRNTYRKLNRFQGSACSLWRYDYVVVTTVAGVAVLTLLPSFIWLETLAFIAVHHEVILTFAKEYWWRFLIQFWG